MSANRHPCVNPALAAILLALANLELRGQGFTNLNFEDNNLPTIPRDQFGGPIPTSDAIPGWRAYYGQNPLMWVLHNSLNAGGVNVSILGPDWSHSPIISGRFQVILQAGAINGLFVSASIAQSGTIPEGMNSLLFTAQDFPGQRPQMAVYFNGASLEFYSLSNLGMPDTYAADIRQYSGMFGDLEFASLSSPRIYNDVSLDDIRFSTLIVPEPSIASLAAAGLAFLILPSMRKRDQVLLIR